MKKSNKIFVVLLVLTLTFIYSQSTLSQTVSGNESGRLLAFLQKTFPFLSFVTHNMIRKLAHMFEHFVLGLELTYLCRNKNGKWKYLMPLNIGFICAFLDESLQMFTGRGPAIPDVWIDFSGVLIGMVFVSLLILITEKFRKKAD